MSARRTTFASITAPEKCNRPESETVGIAIEITGPKHALQIGVWVAEELEPDLKRDAVLRAGIVDALSDFLNRITGVQ